MTELNEAREAIYSRFTTQWKAVGGLTDLTPFTFDNEAFTPPEAASWVRVAIRHLTAMQETLGSAGNRKFAHPGTLLIQVFTPTNSGMASSDTLCQKAREIFEGVSLSGTTVRFQSSTVREAGNDGKWNQMVVETLFEYDETR